jgi:carbamoyl-phosphate synthase small subunit
LQQTSKAARIILEDGTEFEGVSFGHECSASGEITFYTGMADLPRLLSDPALRGAILVLAQPVAGITGVPAPELCPLGLEKFFESAEAQIAGLVVSSSAEIPSHYASEKSLPKWLKKQQVPGIEGIDTRALIQRIGVRGTMRAKILVSDTKDVSFSSANQHSQPANASVKKTVTYGSGKKKIVLVDCGVKNSVIRKLVTNDTSVIRVPSTYDYGKDDFDAVCVAGGPGDPTSCDKTIAVLKDVLQAKKPVFATGQGAVILAIAAGASAFRMAQGHRSASVPCVDLESGRCYITAQNHGYGIRDDSLPAGWTPTFLNNADNSVEGFSAMKGLFSGVLFQPEGNPGPADTEFLYGNFIELVRNGGIVK